MAAAPISTALGSPISAALLEMHGVMGLAGWHGCSSSRVFQRSCSASWSFSNEDGPEKAKWLPDEERAWLVDTMNAELASKAGHASHSMWRGLADPRVLALSLIYFGTSAGLYTLGIWAPQIIKQLARSIHRETTCVEC